MPYSGPSEFHSAFQSNFVLDTVPAASRAILLQGMDYVSLPVGHVLYRPRETPRFVHFLTSGLCSVLTPLTTGDGVDVGLIGSEGLVEAFHLLGPAEVSTEALVQVQATALRAPFATVQQEFLGSQPVRQLVLQQVQEQSLVATQLAACNVYHSVDARLARWLLMIADRLGTSRFVITQEFLADMVGARRPTVTLAAGKLQRTGVIRYNRGLVEICERALLESLACECYPVILGLNARVRAGQRPGPPTPLQHRERSS